MAASALRCVLILAALGSLVGCSEPAETPAPRPRNPASPISTAPVESAAPVGAPAAVSPLSAEAEAINAAQFGPNEAFSSPSPAFDPLLVRVQVLLDRARFSPGVIDGKNGENLRHALAAFEQARGLDPDGRLDAQAWAALAEGDTGAVVQSYVITAQDVAGPFIGVRPDDYEALAALPAVGYERASEALAEKFHMDEDLLLALNPGSGFAAGQAIAVAVAGPDTLDARVAAIEVDKVAKAIRAYDAVGTLVAFYPASVGSKEYPAPSGTWTVKAVVRDPTYYYNPDRLTFGRDKANGRLEIKPGANNPVGSAWIDLSLDTYGIHGSPDPRTIGKGQSHGCVRLTNWDAVELATGVKAGVKVAFVGA